MSVFSGNAFSLIRRFTAGSTLSEVRFESRDVQQIGSFATCGAFAAITDDFARIPSAGFPLPLQLLNVAV